MTQSIVESEADSLEEARQQLQAQIPPGYIMLDERVVVNGEPQIVEASGDSLEVAIAEARRKIPNNAEILKEQNTPSRNNSIRITVEAFNEQDAVAQGLIAAKKQPNKTLVLHGVKLIKPGHKGFLGLGKKTHQYEVELLEPQFATAKITFKTKVKITCTVTNIADAVENALHSLKGEASERATALELLDKVAWTPSPDEAGAHYWIEKQTWDRCVEVGVAAIKPLIEVAVSGGFINEAAIESVLKINQPAATLEALAPFIKHDHYYRRQVAMSALGQLYPLDPAEISSLLIAAALNDPSDGVQSWAISALRKTRDSSGMEPIINLALTHKSSTVRQAAIDYIADIGGTNASAALNEILRTERDFNLRARTQKALDQLGVETDLDKQSQITYAEASGLLETLPINGMNHVSFFERLLDYDHDLYVTPNSSDKQDYAGISRLLIRFLTGDPHKTASRSWTIRENMLEAKWIESFGPNDKYIRSMLILRIDEDVYLYRQGRFEHGYS